MKVDIVYPDSNRCCCFTKSYYRYVKGTGSLLATTNIQKHEVQSLLEMGLRIFTPREVANLHSFPEEFQFPKHITLRQQNHCLLLVFRVEMNEIYVFDPRAECKHKLDIKPQVNMAFKIYKAFGGKSRGTTLKWKHVKCPQQSGATDCVYHVMRYMHDIVKNHHQNINLQKDFVQDGSYSEQEIDEV